MNITLQNVYLYYDDVSVQNTYTFLIQKHDENCVRLQNIEVILQIVFQHGCTINKQRGT